MIRQKTHQTNPMAPGDPFDIPFDLLGPSEAPLISLGHLGHSGEYGNGAKLVWKMSKSVMQLISIRL